MAPLVNSDSDREDLRWLCEDGQLSLSALNPILKEDRTLFLLLLHDCLSITIWLEDASCQNLGCSIMNLLPAMEATTLT